MQVKAFIGSLATLGLGVLTACGSNSPTEVVVKPGITAIRESNAIACSTDLQNMQLAIEAYATLNAAPPAAESDLVPDWLRAESELYDLVDGQVVAAPGSECPAASADATGAAPDTTANDETARECSVRYKTLLVAIEAYFAMNGMSTIPTEQILVDAGLLRALDEAYDVDPAGLVAAVPGGICDGVPLSTDPTTTQPSGPGALPADASECLAQHKVLEVAIEAYVATYGSPPASESDLVPDWLRSELSGYDIVDGTITPAPGSPCP